MSRDEQEPIAIGYMPWADLHEELRVGPICFWPFHSKAQEKISSPQIRADLAKFFQIFVDNTGQPVQTVTACSHGDVDFRRFTEAENRVINAAVDCLLFAAIATGSKNGVCANNDSMAPPSADRFDLCARWVWPNNSGIVVQTDNSLSFWTHGKYKITQPLSVGGSFMGNYQPLLEGLGRTFDSAFPADVRERMFRSLEWFRFAHTESTAVSLLHKVVMMATAFEIFLGFPDYGKTGHFVQEVHNQMELNDSILVTRKDNKGNEYQVCRPAEWAAQFYDLRSRIVHGEQVTGQDFLYKDWITHLVVADLVLLELVKRLLYHHGCIGSDIRKQAEQYASKSSDSFENIEAVLLPGILGLDLERVQEALGWIPSRDERLRKYSSRSKKGKPDSEG